MLGVISHSAVWRVRPLLAAISCCRSCFSLNALLGMLLVLTGLGYLYIQDYDRLLQIELQQQRAHLRYLFDEQYQLLLERQVVASHKRFELDGSGKSSDAMHFPKRQETVTVVCDRVV